MSRTVQKETPATKVCQHLHDYEEYVLRTQTRELGGISPSFCARSARQLFPYKDFPPLKGAVLQDPLLEVPEHGNKDAPENSWTKHEQGRFDETLQAWARWEVNYAGGFVASPRCEGVTTNIDAICDACKRVAND